MAGPLAGVRVVDMTSALMGPYATQIMGDLGADVIKIESRSGDSLRLNGIGRHPGMGPLFLHANRNKRSIVIDVKQAAGRDAVFDLLASADVFIFNLRPASMRRLGLGYEAVGGANPRIVYCGLCGFGEEGPYAGKPAYDDMIQGAASLPSLAQRATGDPRYAPSALADRVAGMTAVYAVLAALYNRERTGCGQSLTVPMFERMVEFVLADHMYGWTFDPPIGGTGYPRQLAPERRPYRTRDGYVCAMPYLDKHWRSFFDLAGLQGLKDDSRFADLTARTEHIAELYAIVAEALLARSTAEWMSLFEREDIPAMPLHTPESVMSDPHLVATGFFEVADHPSEGRIRTMAVPIRYHGTPAATRRQAPRLGEHSAEILREIGYSDDAIDALVATGAVECAAPP